MRQTNRQRYLLVAPLIYLAALLLLIEEWFWHAGLRLGRLLVGWPPLKALEARIAALGPYPALCLFVLPALLLFPVKLLALVAIASGHVVSGICVIVLAKLGGAAALARIYLLTRPALLTLAWFARWHNAFMLLKERWLGRLRDTIAYRYTRMLMARLRWLGRDLVARLRGKRGRHSRRHARIVRRLLAMWRARRINGKNTR